MLFDGQFATLSVLRGFVEHVHMASSVLGGAREGVALRVVAATRPGELDNPAWRLHPLKGDLAGHWSVRVSNNWRVTFRFEEGEAVDVNLIDYH